MATIQRALKIRLYPLPEQAVLINKTLGSCRFLFNKMLAERKATYELLKNNRESLYAYKYKTEKEYKQEFEWLKEVDSTALQQSRMNLETAYKNFYKSLKEVRKGEKIGFPKFKEKKDHKDSFRSVMGMAINFDNSTLKLIKLKAIPFKHKVIKRWYLTAILKNVTVSKTPTGKYYASCLFEGEQDFKGNKSYNKIIGLDMSLQNFYVDALGNLPNYPKANRTYQLKLAKAQKLLSRKTRGGKNREKARIKVARIHEKISNTRLDFLEKLSLKLVQENDVVVVEDLSLKGMAQAMNFGKSVMDLGYNAFINKLKYKALWYDKTIVVADKWFASSKTCHHCGHVNKDLQLQERTWVCPSCGIILNRDINAAVNLENYGKKILTECKEFTPVDIESLAGPLQVLPNLVGEAGTSSGDSEAKKSLASW